MLNKIFTLTIFLSVSIASITINTAYPSSYNITDFNNNGSMTVELSIGPLKFINKEISDEKYTTIAIDNSYPSTLIGEPNLPFINNLIEIPHESNIRIEIIEDEIEEYNLNDYNLNNPLLPVQPSISKSQDSNNITFTKNEEIYNLNEFYKNPLIQVQEKGLLRETLIGNLMLSPIEYNPVTNQIKLHKKIKFTIYFDNANYDLTNERKNKSFSPYFESIYKNSIINYIEPQNQTRNNNFLNNKVSYIIISDPIFNNELQSFINWKTLKGYNVIIAYTDEIGSSAAAIKSFIQDQYDNPPNNSSPPSFVLLVGDTQQIPASYSSGGHVSDLDYCDFTNDNIPDILCGRFSAQNPNQLQAQIQKTLEYEQYDMPDPSFLNNVIMISGVDANYAPTYGNGQINYGNNYYFNSNNNINSNTFLYPASTSSDAQILNLSNAGASFINYTAHGWESGWADPEFNTSDANNMTNNHKYPTMVGNCCLTNAFDSGVCFGEALLRKSNGGAIGYIGASDVTYWDEDFWWGVGAGNISANPSYNNTGAGTYDGMFHENNEANWATVNSAIIMMGNLAVAEGNGMDDYYWEIYHLMGDPSISTYFSVPNSNNISFNPFLPIGSEAIEIQANPHSYVGLSQDGVLLGSGTVDESGYVVLVFEPITEPGSLDLVITAQNTEPYFDEIFVASPEGSYITVNDINILSGMDNTISIGESISISLTLENAGSESASNIDVTLSNINNDPAIDITNGYYEIENLNYGETTTANLEFSVSNDCPFGHSFQISIEVFSEDNNWTQIIDLNVEDLIESFESADFENFLWEFNGDSSWLISNFNTSNGDYSARSGIIDHNMSSDIYITMEIVEDGYIYFDKKVSCEDAGSQTGNYYDYLSFYIDDQEQDRWAGEIDWSQSAYAVSTGEHTFLWRYIKDQAATSGQDAVWIDNLIFPPSYYNVILIGDANFDSTINIQDVIVTVNIILNSLDYNLGADINEDELIDVLDVIGIVNIILQ